ncbi:MAG: ATP-binding cassette domain-containing protein [Nitrospirae bacterium]|nr:MAG: ATP-binding cassette domain-containing protein [Nitrospirota bacterium]
MPPAIEVSHLKKVFGSVVAVEDVSFTVSKGQIFGFLGPNGAGKSTTINILCTLLKPTAGRALVNGYDCLREPHRVRKSIGVVFQDPTLDRDLTAYENLYYHAVLYDVPPDRRKHLVEEALEFVGLKSRKDTLVRHFSGGMRRRLEVARAVVHQPEVLFLDEPTTGLDPQSRAALWDYIKELPEKKGVTVFMTTHYMDEAEICDRIAIIDHGRIIAEGSPDELKASLGGDVIYIKVRDSKEALKKLYSVFPDATLKGEEIAITVSSGPEKAPEILNLLGRDVLSVRLQRPTLNDVFLHLTGRQIRPESLDEEDELKEAIRSYRRRFDRT